MFEDINVEYAKVRKPPINFKMFPIKPFPWASLNYYNLYAYMKCFVRNDRLTDQRTA